eukprot:GHVT01008716.1.p1 GENE.GHVT01008716.1~~GHVT01008716.1.p1  ORF type:complete len:114 (-),score=9.30 GHVT01008716.1:107-448(-)
MVKKLSSSSFSLNVLAALQRVPVWRFANLVEDLQLFNDYLVGNFSSLALGCRQDSFFGQMSSRLPCWVPVRYTKAGPGRTAFGIVTSLYPCMPGKLFRTSPSAMQITSRLSRS